MASNVHPPYPESDSAAETAKRRSGASPFFHTPRTALPGSMAILHLKRDSLLPITLRASADDGYAEGAVTNTRFGSFPHSTLIGLDWGSQVRASKVDTGTRGRKDKRKLAEVASDLNPAESPAKKFKQLPDGDGLASVPAALKAPIEAGSGFTHILPPTPEAWTSSLDHRTQVVYTPDYSYVLQRLRVMPGSTIIEAGAGSGSFTHAAARAIFSGYPNTEHRGKDTSTAMGRVCSFEYHEPRVQTLSEELREHGLDGIVTLTHRDVCSDGFALSDSTCPRADAVFLDLPAPWLALKHLTRGVSDSPLNPDAAVHLCTFSPCIEQVTATVSSLRQSGWVEIEMVEVANQRIDVRREQIGLQNEGLRGVNAAAATVEEAIGRLREVESKLSDFHANKEIAKAEGGIPNGDAEATKRVQSRRERLEKIKIEAESRKLYKEGNLVHRAEPEVKTHTSYLVFATLPREWTEEDEEACAAKWSVKEVLASGSNPKEI